LVFVAPARVNAGILVSGLLRCTAAPVPPPLYRRPCTAAFRRCVPPRRKSAVQSGVFPRRLKSAVRGGVFPPDASLRYEAVCSPHRLKSAVQVHSLFFCTTSLYRRLQAVCSPQMQVCGTKRCVPSQTEVCGTRRTLCFLYRRPCTAAFRRCVSPRRKSAIQGSAFPSQTQVCDTRQRVSLAD